MLKRKEGIKNNNRKSASIQLFKLFTFHKNQKGLFLIELFPEKPNTDIVFHSRKAKTSCRAILEQY